MPLGDAELALALLVVAALALAVLWIYRFVQYRRAVRRSQARWLTYEPAQIYAEEEMGLNWPTMKPILLSPIPEERFESGRESENESMLAVRKDPMRLSAVSIVPYGSFDQPTTTYDDGNSHPLLGEAARFLRLHNPELFVVYWVSVMKSPLRELQPPKMETPSDRVALQHLAARHQRLGLYWC